MEKKVKSIEYKQQAIDKADEAYRVNAPPLQLWRRFKGQKSALFALGIAGLLIVLVAFGPYLAPYEPNEPDYEHVLEKPSFKHLTGTDEYGRDILSRIIIGARISLALGVSSVTLGMVVGTILGLISGYYGGLLDNLIMRLCDVLFAFPGILLAIAAIAILGPGLHNVVISIAIFSMPIFCRLVRGNTLAIKATPYVEAARSLGATNSRIIFKHIFPGTVSSIIIYFTMRISTAILTAGSLSFIGLGAQPPTPEWGAMLSSGRDYLNVAPHIAIFPGLAIYITVLAFNLLGDALRDTLDPKLKC